MPLALCQDVMTEGLHYAEFKALRGGDIKIGIVRPGKEWDCKKMKIGLLDERSGFIHYCVQEQSSGKMKGTLATFTISCTTKFLKTLEQ